MNANSPRPLVSPGVARTGAMVGLALAGLALVGVALAQDSADPCIGPDGTPIVGDEDCPGNGGAGKHFCSCKESSPCGLRQRRCNDYEVAECCPASITCVVSDFRKPFPPGCFR